jgi:hypothetical protein
MTQHRGLLFRVPSASLLLQNTLQRAAPLMLTALCARAGSR